jgi:beta-1,2-mannobiose phosphorylase / 1,2-beta-oligomannan phosphorylase
MSEHCRFLFPIASLLLVAGQLWAADQPLPKVRIAKDGRTFETERGRPFVPFGVNYYRPGTGWAPQVWKQFDAEATRKDFARMKELGVNCVRVFLSYGSFYTEPGVLRQEGLDKFEQFLRLAEQAGIYVHPTGPDHWEGPPSWRPVAVADPRTLQYTVQFWERFAARYRGRHVIFAYDLKNEPLIDWQSEVMPPQWNAWLEKKYGSSQKVAAAWGVTNQLQLGQVAVPPAKSAPRSRELLDYQAFRADVADEWTRRQVAAIKAADPDALVTVGLLQSSVPSLYWGGMGETGFRPEGQAKFLDFLEVHFYPLARGCYEYKSEADELANLAYLESILREVARPGKPVVLAEFGWYGGAEKPTFDKGAHPIGTEEQQAKYLRRVVQTSAGFVVGWLNWGFYDNPGAHDCSELTGLLRVDGTAKAWGKTFQELSARYCGTRIAPAKIGARPELDWDASITDSAAANLFRDQYLKAFLADQPQTSVPATPAPETAGGWVKYEGNPIMGGQYGTCFDVSVLRDGGTYRMWLSWRPKRSLALVESKDGMHWSEPPRIILGPRSETGWEDDINRPAVLKREDGYHLWYTGQAKGHSAIGYATSRDGVGWRRMSDQPVLSAEKAWEKVAVMCPDVLWDAQLGLFRMWYSGGEQNEPNAIGYATSRDGLRWTKHPANPVFAPDPKLAWEKHKVTACQVERRGDWHIMFYLGFRDEPLAQIGLARSRDGITHWQRHPANPIIRPGQNQWDQDACYKPYAVFDGQGWLLWYNGRRGDLEQIGLVRHAGEDLGF